ncbi:hypothetical protein [Streptomyces sp. NPDC000878]
MGETGEVHAYFNIRTPGSLQPIWSEKLSWAPGVADANLNLLRFADVDNDDTADYVVIYDGGAIRAWLNRGGNTPPPPGPVTEPADPPQGPSPSP